jgi:hypothetical protein
LPALNAADSEQPLPQFGEGFPQAHFSSSKTGQENETAQAPIFRSQRQADESIGQVAVLSGKACLEAISTFPRLKRSANY